MQLRPLDQFPDQVSRVYADAHRAVSMWVLISKVKSNPQRLSAFALPWFAHKLHNSRLFMNIDYNDTYWQLVESPVAIHILLIR